jgi:ATP-dependent RNA helicase DeaD
MDQYERKDEELEEGVLEDASDEAADDGDGDGPDEAPDDEVIDLEVVFAGVPPAMRKALVERGFTRMTPVQQAVLAAGAAGDLRISSETGSGKTVAIGLCVAQALADGVATSAPRVLVVVPTRELAAQIEREFAWLFAGVPNAGVVSVTGGTSTYQERQRLQRRPAIVVGTPGRLVDHITRGAFDTSALREVVLDEADQMLDMGFREDLEKILAAAPAERRTHLVSATFPQEIQRLADTYQRDPRRVEGTRLGDANTNIEHVVHMVGRDDRYDVLVNLLLLADGERTLVFVNTRADVAKVAQQLADDGFAALPLSGDMAQNERTRTLASFRAGKVTTLVATDVAARGLDVPDVAMVVHATPSIDAESYVHRSGRTGRAGARGRSVVLAPGAKQRGLRRVFEWAKVDAQWLAAPSAHEVEAVLADRRRRSILAAVDAAEGVTPASREMARRLLEEREALEVVAVLLERGPRRPPTHPRNVRSLVTRDARPNERRDRPGRNDERQPAGVELSGVARGELGFLRFEINWGMRGGATPQRILAHVCRRGGVTSRAIGAIVIGDDASSIDVAEEAAPGFAQRVQRRDSREPNLVIVPLAAERLERPRRENDQERPRWRSRR